MRDFVFLPMAFTAGSLLGAIFFGGLWWTVRKGIASEQPALWFFGSFLLRTGMTVAGFYYVGGDQWVRWLACLLGFVLARLVAWRLARPAGRNQGQAPQGANHAP